MEPIKIFLSYRRADTTAGTARALYNELSQHFGTANVFFDLVSLKPGMDFLQEIREQTAGCGVFLALIGPKWLAILKERQQRYATEGQQDVVRLEIERALDRQSRVSLIPIAVDGAIPPGTEELPGLLSSLARRHAAPLRHERWDDDVTSLVERVRELGRVKQDTADPVPEPTLAPIAVPAVAASKVAPAPGQEHFEEVVRCLARGTIVPFLGSAVNACDRTGDWGGPASGQLPTAEELAKHLAEEFELGSHGLDLAHVAQYVCATQKPELYETLGTIFAAGHEPPSVHRFLAALPSTMKRLRLPKRFQLIVTTNYDDALERAFVEADEPYDVAVYLTSGPRKGDFLHIPCDGEPAVIDVPHKYLGFPFGEGSQVERTTILKIHGSAANWPRAIRPLNAATDGGPAKYTLDQNYVITDDHYIEYLSQSPISQLVPTQVLGKMLKSHFLFLGYAMRDWSLRVFLQRAWGGADLPGQSWAIERDPDALEKRFWRPLNVDLFALPLPIYVRTLEEQLAAYAEARSRV